MNGRARVAVVVTAGAVGLALAGCTPVGVDGDLVNSWGAMPEPTGFVPDPGVCHQTTYQETVALAEYLPVDCEREHRTETVHVGEFAGQGAERGSPPSPGSGDWREAYAQCETGAAEYLGADFRHGPLWLGVTVPTEVAWSGGARWVRCEVMELEEEQRQGSLAGILTEPSDFALGCFAATVDNDAGVVESLDPTGCDETHDTEFVGVWHSTEASYPAGDDDAAWRRIHSGCLDLVADFVDVPKDDDLSARSGTIAVPMEQEDWDNGDRGFRCYLWLDGFETDQSLRDAGPGELPVR